MSKTIELTAEQLAFLIGELSDTHTEQSDVFLRELTELNEMEAEDLDHVIGSIRHGKQREAVNRAGEKLTYATELLAKLTR